ncbi:MAG: sodium:solute symporter family protein, partial [Leptospirales bacterium]|nr:sodium:solute symporter family protein [Leptospirales bacterium]
MSLSIILASLLITFLIGISIREKNGGIVNYYVGGRSKSSSSVTGSLVATAIGGSATLGLSGLAYAKGFPAIWWLFSASISLLIFGLFWAKKVRAYEVFTLPEVLEKEYDSSSIKIASSFIIVIAWLGIIAAQMIAAGKILYIVWPGYYEISIILCAAIILIYTLRGGQNSVIKTEVFQFILIFIGIILTLILAYIKYGNLSARLLPEGHLNFPTNQEIGFREIFTYFLFVGTSFIVGPDIYSRIFSAKDQKAAQRSIFKSSFIIAVLAVLIILIGLYSKMISPGIEQETSFQYLVINTAPVYLQGIIFAALIAAFLSTSSACILTSGIILTNDILNPILFKNRLSDEKKLLITKLMIITCAIASLLTAIHVTKIIESLLFALTIYTSGVVPPVILGFYKDKFRLNKYGAMAGLLIGTSSALILKY